MRYRIRFSEEALKALPRLPGRYRQRLRRLIEALASAPRPAEARKLRDLPGVYRIRVNGWRLIYLVDDETGSLYILGIRKKTGSETYENLMVE